jgi:hypothetical protein
MLERIGRIQASHHASRNAHHGRLVRHRANHHRARADLGIIADADVAENLRAGADHHAVADGRVPFARDLASAAQRDALVKQHVVADLRGFADHHAHSMIDEEALADGRARMNLDTGHRSRELADHASRREPAGAIQAMRHAMQQHGVEARVAQYDLEHTAGGRIAPEYRVDLLANRLEHVSEQPCNSIMLEWCVPR